MNWHLITADIFDMNFKVALKYDQQQSSYCNVNMQLCKIWEFCISILVHPKQISVVLKSEKQKKKKKKKKKILSSFCNF